MAALNVITKTVTLIVAPVLALTSFLLALFVYLSPVLIFHDQLSLSTIVPALVNNQTSSKGVDGPALLLGLLGSCSRKSDELGVECTSPSLSPQYDTTLLPKSLPPFITSPVSGTPVFAFFALLLWAYFLITFSLHCASERFAGLKKLTGRPLVARLTAWVGVLAFMVSITAYLIMRMWIGRAVNDFNAQIVLLGKSAPQLYASVGNGFTMMWVAQGFLAAPVICALGKLHMTVVPTGKV